MKNLHLVPVNVTDLAEKIFIKNLHENEHMNYILRLEAIRDFCSEALMKQKLQKPVVKPNTRPFR
jgi:hypothetical protein